jgi:NAD(P)-dependent dehydrogenase (short-subunit alcohol dehydrogenase family)
MTLAKEWGRLQTTVYCVAFGFIETRLTVADSDEGAVAHIEGREIKVGMNREIKQAMESIIPLGRVGTPEDAAGAIYLFCQPKSDYVTDRPSCAAAASQASDHPRPVQRVIRMRQHEVPHCECRDVETASWHCHG